MSVLKESDSQEDSLNSSVSGPQPGPAVILDDLIGAAEIAAKKTEEHFFNKNKTIGDVFQTPQETSASVSSSKFIASRITRRGTSLISWMPTATQA